ncbi:NAD(P)H-flavin reductase [Neptunicella sp. SCSIO 80796]|uniref:NAD(P)H-flavin reductase n=1 Tax=Neptunicella plasticusilytica TaxID=3117012 RepID=UPI003A4E1D27
MTEIVCKLNKIEPLTPFVKQIVLQPDASLDFKPGQYIRVVMADTDRRPFSIVNAPGDSQQVELHIGASEQNPYAWEVLQHLEQHNQCIIDGPHGKAFLRDSQPKPTILLAGGTGYSYTSSILQALLGNNGKEPIFLYWGTRTLQDMYALEELQDLAKQHRNFAFVPVIENPTADWQGRTGRVHEAVLADFVSLEPYQVYVAGRFEMAGVAREDFHAQGLLLENLYGDAFEFI